MAEGQSKFLKATVREFKTKNGKVGFNIEINVKDLVDNFEVNQYGEARLTMRGRKEKGKHGETHFIVENDFTPEKQEQKENNENKGVEDDLPF